MTGARKQLKPYNIYPTHTRQPGIKQPDRWFSDSHEFFNKFMSILRRTGIYCAYHIDGIGTAYMRSIRYHAISCT